MTETRKSNLGIYKWIGSALLMAAFCFRIWTWYTVQKVKNMDPNDVGVPQAVMDQADRRLEEMASDADENPAKYSASNLLKIARGEEGVDEADDVDKN